MTSHAKLIALSIFNTVLPILFERFANFYLYSNLQLRTLTGTINS